MKNKKELGQHWLKDRAVLDEIVDFADIKNRTVLEIGPGLGTLTSSILKKAKKVIAVEFDQDLAQKLPAQFPGKNLTIVNQDILQFNFNNLPSDYDVVANLPYYITAKIINRIMQTNNKPKSITILVQKEVAQRLAQINGNSVLGVAVENYAKVELGLIVLPELFTPPPKVDSQVVKIIFRKKPLIAPEAEFMRLVKAAFSAKRKKLRSSLAGGLAISKSSAEKILKKADIDPNLRAEQLSFDDFQKIFQSMH